jgi:hypothetical protein
MRKALAVIVAAAGIGLGATSALATLDLVATIDKTKDITVTETLDKLKIVSLFIVINVEVDKAAESLSLVNQTNDNNEGCSNCAEKKDIIITSLGQSGSGNSGIVTLNEAAGNMNNQGNSIAVAVDADRVPGGPDGEQIDGVGFGFAEAQSSVDQRNGSFYVFASFSNEVDAINLFFRDALIEDSIIDNTGIVALNQAPGNMYNQANSVSIAASFAELGGVALSESDLGQVNVNNLVQESNDGFEPNIGIHKSAVIKGSIIGNMGFVLANQGSGNMGNQANGVAFSVVQF